MAGYRQFYLLNKRLLTVCLHSQFILSDINECHANTDRCQQECHNTRGSYTCSCRTGYRLRSDRRSCYGISFISLNFVCVCKWFSHLDIDECREGSHRCRQSCHNAVGSYACSCYRGYRLNQDGVSCRGKAVVIFDHDNILVGKD